MNHLNSTKPIPRSKLRITLGKWVYTMQRRWKWIRMRKEMARTRSTEALPYQIAAHRTPLIRGLRDVPSFIEQNKVHNLSLAIKKLHGITINPGETFSYWRLIGKPSRRKGYVEGMVLFYGQMRLGVGGGLCQLSNLIYWMTLHTPLQVVERHRHTYDVFPDEKRTQPFGSGATCAYNYLDLMIYNPTDAPYQLHLFLDEKELSGEWRSDLPSLYKYELYEKEHWISQEPWGGYVRHNVLHRTIYKETGECCGDEHVTQNHALMMYAPLLKNGRGNFDGDSQSACESNHIKGGVQ